MKTPKALIITNFIILITFLLPTFYLIWRFLTFTKSYVSFFRSWNVFDLLLNTMLLFIFVVISSLILGLLISIILVRFNIPGSKILFTLSVLPLVIPSYIGALTYVSAFSPKGLFVQLFSSLGINEIAGIDGFFGSWLVLTLFTYPYVLLICSSALRNLDSTVEDAARSLGKNRFNVYTQVVIPRLKKPIIFSGLLVGLYVISDFGAVSLMRYSTLTKAIYSYYEFNINGDPVIFYSSILIVLALLISFIQRGSEEARSAKVSGTPKISEKTNLSPRSKVLIYTFLSLVIFSGLILPISVLSYWLIRGLSAGNSVRAVFGGVVGSLSVSLLAALFSVIVSTPIIIMVSQYRSKFGNVLERIMLALYGLPHISVGVAILFITIKIFPSIYQSFTALIISYLIVFLPQAIGAGQASMEQVKSNYLDASSGLGMSKLKSFYRITLPLIYRGLFAGGALVFLSTMKELPQTLLLRPTGLNTMAIDIWSYASEGLFTQAAFSSFILLAISAIPTYILSTRNLTT
ncbi:MAG: iron ABC transporter permease [Candidatus Actinomarina sp.]|nr:iron ABC transporter permease [Candidatus Actinomarina sp.]MDG1228371.1 iron ABC transporter permease [Candidatus Actinomarina sp.]MDG1739954.1 iron ABC transporter permease [Candidatus Actinomarina sp.]MDG2083018.1 iron ABC transporter permease [Candidatus Actinomarina sp.]